MGLMMSEGKFVGRDEIALVPTPAATARAAVLAWAWPW